MYEDQAHSNMPRFFIVLDDYLMGCPYREDYVERISRIIYASRLSDIEAETHLMDVIRESPSNAPDFYEVFLSVCIKSCIRPKRFWDYILSE